MKIIYFYGFWKTIRATRRRIKFQNDKMNITDRKTVAVAVVSKLNTQERISRFVSYTQTNKSITISSRWHIGKSSHRANRRIRTRPTARTHPLSVSVTIFPHRLSNTWVCHSEPYCFLLYLNSPLYTISVNSRGGQKLHVCYASARKCFSGARGVAG